ncbi:MAG: hypothetical protein ABJ176_18765, partial [Anderseniella sp.]
ERTEFHWPAVGDDWHYAKNAQTHQRQRYSASGSRIQYAILLDNWVQQLQCLQQEFSFIS